MSQPSSTATRVRATAQPTGRAINAWIHRASRGSTAAAVWTATATAGPTRPLSTAPPLPGCTTAHSATRRVRTGTRTALTTGRVNRPSGTTATVTATETTALLEPGNATASQMTIPSGTTPMTTATVTTQPAPLLTTARWPRGTRLPTGWPARTRMGTDGRTLTRVHSHIPSEMRIPMHPTRSSGVIRMAMVSVISPAASTETSVLSSSAISTASWDGAVHCPRTTATATASSTMMTSVSTPRWVSRWIPPVRGPAALRCRRTTMAMASPTRSTSVPTPPRHQKM